MTALTYPMETAVGRVCDTLKGVVRDAWDNLWRKMDRQELLRWRLPAR